MVDKKLWTLHSTSTSSREASDHGTPCTSSLAMSGYLLQIHMLMLAVLYAGTEPIQLPPFKEMAAHYPGYWNFGGRFHNHHLLRMLGTHSSLLLHDTSALRLSYSLNRIGGVHSLGRNVVRLSKFGTDSVVGGDGLQYIYHPIAYGPFMADRYGYPTVSKLHEMDPVSAKKNFWGRQGILRVITYTRELNRPKGHVALWDCDHFHQSKDWIAGHSLITVEFWEAPDSDCSHLDAPESSKSQETLESLPRLPNFKTLLRHKPWRSKFLDKFFLEKREDEPFNW